MAAPLIEFISSIPPCELGEAPHWDDDSQSLLFVDAFQSKCHRYFPLSGQLQTLTINGVTASSGNSVTFVIPVADEADVFLVSVGRHIGLVRWRASDPANKVVDLVPLVEVDEKYPTNRLNDGKCDSKGRLWAGTKGVETSPGVIADKSGNLFMFDEEMSPQIMANQISLSNGLTWSADGVKFFYIDTPVFSVDSFDHNPLSGEIKNRQKLVEYKSVCLTEDCPDGMTVDTDGNLWVANYLGSKIVCISPEEKRIIRTIEMPIKCPTCVTFGGKDYSEMYVTTSQFEFTEEELRLKPNSGGVFRITGLGVKGYPPNKARLSQKTIAKMTQK